MPGFCSVVSQKIATKIIQSEIFIRSKDIGIYIPIENEVDTWAVIKTICEEGKNCYLPAFFSDAKNRLCFVKFMSGDRLLPGKMGKVLEPEILPEKIISPEKLDLVIVPLLGFTDTRYRLGRGNGCYDNTFAFKNPPNPLLKPYLIGVGYKCQQMEFEPDPWDVVMDEIVTE